MNWDLTYHFKDQTEFEKGLADCQQMVAQFGNYRGKLGNIEDFRAYYLLQKELEVTASRVYQYASLRSDLNKKDVANEADVQKCQMMLYQLNELTSFELPEIMALGKERVFAMLDQLPELAEFRFGFEKAFHDADHILDAKSEQLLSFYNPISGIGGDLYSALAVGDGKGVNVQLSNGQEVLVTQGNYRALIEDSSDASDRKKIFEAVYQTYDEHKTTYATIYNSVLLADKAEASARKYQNALEAHLYHNNIPVEVYHNLVDVAGSNNASLKKYIQLRQKYLGLAEYHTYDRFMQLASSNKKYTYEEAQNLFFNALANFPADFQAKAHEVLRPGFVDVMEKEGKRTGAYSSSMPNLHPFILLNYDNTLDSVFTVAHEAGHSMHSMYAAEAQPVMLQGYTIFVAEIASTFNEHALLDYFLNLPDVTKNEKIMVIQQAIDNIVGTFYRQTLFAEYELKAHEMAENDQPINYQVLSGIMTDLYQKYYGLDITKEVLKPFVWAYIPHLFYTPFYVYQYATSFAASFKLYKDVSSGVPGAIDRYVGLLKSGGSKYPVDQAKAAGVDFMQKETFMAVVERLDELVAKLEELLK